MYQFVANIFLNIKINILLKLNFLWISINLYLVRLYGTITLTYGNFPDKLVS